MMRILMIAGSMLAALLAAPVEGRDKDLERLLAITPEQFENSVTRSGDELEPKLIFSTEEGFTVKGGWITGPSADVYLRAFVDKSSREAAFQIVYWVKYGGEWALIQSANILAANGLITAEASDLGRDVSCSGRSCAYLEAVGVLVPESALRELAARYSSSPAEPMRIRFKTHQGPDYDTSIYPAEAAGLLAAVDQFRSAE